MTFEIELLEKLYNRIHGGVFGLLSVIVGVCGDILAASLFPGYSIFSNMISQLGTGPGAIYFNIGVFLAGFLAVPYVIYLGKISLEHENGNKAFLKIAIIASVISSITLGLIGVVPAYIDNFTILLIHGTIAAICYIAAAVYLLIYSRYMLKDERFSNIFAYIAFINAVLFIIVVFTWLPLIQWMANICIIIWTTLVSAYMLYKKI